MPTTTSTRRRRAKRSFNESSMGSNPTNRSPKRARIDLTARKQASKPMLRVPLSQSDFFAPIAYHERPLGLSDPSEWICQQCHHTQSDHSEQGLQDWMRHLSARHDLRCTSDGCPLMFTSSLHMQVHLEHCPKNVQRVAQPTSSAVVSEEQTEAAPKRKKKRGRRPGRPRKRRVLAPPHDSDSEERKMLEDEEEDEVEEEADVSRRKKNRSRRRQKKAKRKQEEVVSLLDESDISIGEPVSLDLVFHPLNVYSAHLRALEMKKHSGRMSRHRVGRPPDAMYDTLEKMNTRWNRVYDKQKRVKRRKTELSPQVCIALKLIPAEKERSKIERVAYKWEQQVGDATVVTRLYGSVGDQILRYIDRLDDQTELDDVIKFLDYGFQLTRKAVIRSDVRDCLEIHEVLFDEIDEHWRKRTHNFRTMRECEKPISCRELVWRRASENDSLETCTLDLTLGIGSVRAPSVRQMLVNLDCVKHLQRLYAHVYPDKELRLVNHGFFQSPPHNPGQNWHTDFQTRKLLHDDDDAEPGLCPLITILVALTPQSYETHTTRCTGSTVFAARSHHDPQVLLKHMKLDERQSPYHVVQPVLDGGDVVCFSGNLLHFGGAYNKVDESSGNRIVAYGVLHLIDKTCPVGTFLSEDMNIASCSEISSIFGGHRLEIVHDGDEFVCQRANRRTDDVALRGVPHKKRKRKSKKKKEESLKENAVLTAAKLTLPNTDLTHADAICVEDIEMCARSDSDENMAETDWSEAGVDGEQGMAVGEE